jgi:hypothetical protein
MEENIFLHALGSGYYGKRRFLRDDNDACFVIPQGPVFFDCCQSVAMAYSPITLQENWFEAESGRLFSWAQGMAGPSTPFGAKGRAKLRSG